MERVVVEEQGDRGLTRGVDAGLEGIDDRVAVLGVADLEADPSAAVGVEHQVEVEAEHLAVDEDLDPGAVGHPLRPA